jgi:hypothetical protein
MQMPEFKAQGQLVETVHNRLLANLKDFGEDSMSPMKKRDVPPAAVGTVPAESKGVPSEDRYTTLSLKVVSPAGPLGIFLDQKSDTAVVQGPPKSSTAKSKGLNALRVMDGLAGMSIISIDGQNTRNFSGQHVVQILKAKGAEERTIVFERQIKLDDTANIKALEAIIDEKEEQIRNLMTHVMEIEASTKGRSDDSGGRQSDEVDILPKDDLDAPPGDDSFQNGRVAAEIRQIEGSGGDADAVAGGNQGEVPLSKDDNEASSHGRLDRSGSFSKGGEITDDGEMYLHGTAATHFQHEEGGQIGVEQVEALQKVIGEKEEEVRTLMMQLEACRKDSERESENAQNRIWNLEKTNQEREDQMEALTAQLEVCRKDALDGLAKDEQIQNLMAQVHEEDQHGAVTRSVLKTTIRKKEEEVQALKVQLGAYRKEVMQNDENAQNTTQMLEKRICDLEEKLQNKNMQLEAFQNDAEARSNKQSGEISDDGAIILRGAGHLSTIAEKEEEITALKAQLEVLQNKAGERQVSQQRDGIFTDDGEIVLHSISSVQSTEDIGGDHENDTGRVKALQKMISEKMEDIQNLTVQLESCRKAANQDGEKAQNDILSVEKTVHEMEEQIQILTAQLELSREKVSGQIEKEQHIRTLQDSALSLTAQLEVSQNEALYATEKINALEKTIEAKESLSQSVVSHMQTKHQDDSDHIKALEKAIVDKEDQIQTLTAQLEALVENNRNAQNSTRSEAFEHVKALEKAADEKETQVQSLVTQLEICRREAVDNIAKEEQIHALQERCGSLSVQLEKIQNDGAHNTEKVRLIFLL